MCLTEYNETETLEMIREEGRQEGVQEGLLKGKLLAIQNLIDSTGWNTVSFNHTLIQGILQKNPYQLIPTTPCSH